MNASVFEKAVKILQNLADGSPSRQELIVKANPIPIFHKLYAKSQGDAAMLNTLAALGMRVYFKSNQAQERFLGSYSTLPWLFHSDNYVV